MCRKKYFATTCLGTAGALLVAFLGNAHALTSATVLLPNSVRPVEEAPASGSGTPTHAYISRHALTSAEESAPMTFEVSLKMRNLAELQDRIGHGERISPEEMAAKYEPLAADYDAVVNWLEGEGFTILKQDPRHLNIVVQGKVSHVASALAVTFARVTSQGKEYTSAVSAPSVPTDISALLIGINGLQPHIRAHKHIIKATAQPDGSPGSASYLPSQIATAYGLTGLYNSKITGAGQTIAIVIDTVPSTTDLLLFWKNCSVNQSISNIQFVQPVPGALPTASSGEGEETLDTEWCSAIAPGAHVRVYAATDLGSADLDTAYQQVINDATAHPEWGIHQMSMSYGVGEIDATQTQVQTDDNLFLELANLGITSFAASGDYGTTPDVADRVNTVEVESPASDPYVTGVGGTSLQLNSDNSILSEGVWNTFSMIGHSVSGGASGGGTSTYFTAPSWQSQVGATMREVPDVAAAGDPTFGATIYFNGSKMTVGGTSWACPMWAGICALINQARADAGQSPLGVLGPQIYKPSGTSNSNLQDITTGSNTTISGTGSTAVAGYDQATGMGSPKASALAQALLGSSTLAGVQMAPAMQSITPGLNATFTVAASGSATYRWLRMPLGSSSYTALSDNSTYSGSATASLTVTAATEAMSGDSFECQVTLNGTTITTTPSALVVDSPLIISALAGSVGVGALTDGSGTAANFDIPSGIALDSSGNLYVADFTDNAIRKVTPGGTVTTPYGAVFKTPNSVAIDNSGNLYVANTGNNLILKIASGSTSVTTFAGSSGQFNTPEGIAVDNSGNVYVADTLNNCIRKITPGGTVTTVIGQPGTQGYKDGNPTTTALLNHPASVAVDADGDIFVADTGNCVVRELSTTTGAVSTVAGVATTSGYLDGRGSTALFNSPAGITLDAYGNVYVSDCLPPAPGSTAAGNDVVRRITPGGAVSTLAGQPGNEGAALGTGSAALFYSVQAVAINNSTGEFYLADAYNDVTREGGLVPTISVTLTQNAQVFGPTPGLFLVTRSGSPVGSVSLNYTLGGTAVSGTDYQPLTGSVTLPEGANSAIVTVNPIADSSATSSPTLQLTLASSVNYLPGIPSTVTMSIMETSTPFQVWASGNFGVNSTNLSIGGEAADPNHNGVPNLLEYAFNSDPLATGTEPLPVVSTMQDSNGKEHLVITYNAINNDPQLNLAVQVTSDLTQVNDTWHSGSAYTTVIGTPVVTGTVTQTTVEDATPVPAGGHRFIRIRVSE